MAGSGIDKRTVYRILAVGMIVVVLLWVMLTRHAARIVQRRYVELIQQGIAQQQIDENITKLRAQWSDAVANGSSTSQLIDISSQIDTNFVNVRATYEAYPTLFSGTLVANYMGEIVNQEESLSYSRSQYNGAVRDYNTAIKDLNTQFTFNGSLLA